MLQWTLRLAAPLLQMPSPSPSSQLSPSVFSTLCTSPLVFISLSLFSFSCLLWQPSPRITAPRAAPTATATAAAAATRTALLQATTRVAQAAAPRHYCPFSPAAGIRILHSRTIRLSPRHPRCAGRPVPFPDRCSLSVVVLLLTRRWSSCLSSDVERFAAVLWNVREKVSERDNE